MPWSNFRPLLALGAAVVALTSLGAASPTPTPAPTATPDANQQATKLLRLSILAPQSISYVGQMETLRFGNSRADATIMRVEHLAPGMTRRWYLAPEAVYGDYSVTRGITTYQFDTKHSQVTTSRNPSLENQIAAIDSLGLITQNYRVVLGDPETVAGRKSATVLLINKYSGERVIRVWIDSSTDLVLKKEQYGTNGSVVAETRFEELRYTASIPRDVFSTTIPAGYKRVAGRDFASPESNIDHARKEAAFKSIVPKYLPEGFTLVGADVAVVNDVKTLHFLYSDGLRSLSLFENAVDAPANFGKLKVQTVTFEGHEAKYVEDGPTMLLTWQERQLHFALVSDLVLHDLVDIAVSVVP
jgi:outer membrane lipoprotein-sorting protein